MVVGAEGGERPRPADADAARVHQRHLGGHPAARAPPRPDGRGAGRRPAPADPGRLLLRLDGRAHAVRRPRPAGHPAPGPRPARAGLGDRLRDRRPRHRRCVVHPRDRARRDGRRRRGRAAHPAVRRAGAQALPLRVRLPRPPRHPHHRPARAQRARRDRPPAGQGVPGRRRPGDPGPRVRHPVRDRLRRGVRHPLRHGPGQELLRRPHLHPAQPDDPPARHPAQAQPAARRHRGQAARGRRRLDRARQHPARARADAARGRRPRGARADQLAAGQVALLLRHRLRHPGRADRQRPHLRRDLPLDRRRLAGLHQPRGPRRGHLGAQRRPVPRLLRRGLPDPAARAGAPRQGHPRALGRPRSRCPCSTTPDHSPYPPPQERRDPPRAAHRPAGRLRRRRRLHRGRRPGHRADEGVGRQGDAAPR